MISAHRGRKATGDYQKSPGGPEAKLLLERARQTASVFTTLLLGRVHGEGRHAESFFREANRDPEHAQRHAQTRARASGAYYIPW